MLVLSAIASLVALSIWGVERLLADDEHTVWGADLGRWVSRLDAQDAYVRDSAITAVSYLVAREWSEFAATSHGQSSPTRAEVVAALSALVWRIGDADSLLREHAVTAVLDVTAERAPIVRHASVGNAYGDRGESPEDAREGAREEAREVVRDVASTVLRTSARDHSRHASTRSALEVLAAIGAPSQAIPLIAAIATGHASPTVRELALLVVVRSPVPDVRSAGRQRALLLISACDTSAEVRNVAVDATTGPDSSCGHGWSALHR